VAPFELEHDGADRDRHSGITAEMVKIDEFGESIAVVPLE